jgi:hypothetical protein
MPIDAVPIESCWWEVSIMFVDTRTLSRAEGCMLGHPRQHGPFHRGRDAEHLHRDMVGTEEGCR